MAWHSKAFRNSAFLIHLADCIYDREGCRKKGMDMIIGEAGVLDVRIVIANGPIRETY